MLDYFDGHVFIGKSYISVNFSKLVNGVFYFISKIILIH